MWAFVALFLTFIFASKTDGLILWSLETAESKIYLADSIIDHANFYVSRKVTAPIIDKLHVIDRPRVIDTSNSSIVSRKRNLEKYQINSAINYYFRT